MRKLIFILLLILSVVLFSCIASGKPAHAKTNVHYEVHNIRPGDTLWQIASTYSDGNNIDKYVEEIMTFNNMKNTEIKSGQSIIIPIYSWFKSTD